MIADDLHSVDGAFMSNLSELNTVGFKTNDRRSTAKRGEFNGEDLTRLMS